MNEIIRNLSKQAIKQLESCFSTSKDLFWNKETNKLSHPGEFGSYRENIVSKFLSLYIPEKYGIGSGFIITNSGDVSTQCDIIIYDKINTPKIEDNLNQRFFPVEIVVGVGEIKSDINSSSELNKYLEKLSTIKSLREKTKDPIPFFRGFNTPYNPINNPFDQIFTFLICNKFNFKFKSTDITYNNIEPRFRHNILLSINDGTLTYKTDEGTKNLYFPVGGDSIFSYHWLEKNSNEFSDHMGIFLNSLFTGIKSTTILDMDIALYLTNNTCDKII